MFIFCVYPYFAFHWTPWTRKQCIHIRQRVRMCSISPVWVLHCTVADTEQVVLPHVYSSWSLLQADYSKNFFLLKYHVNFCLSRGKVYTGYYSLFKANVTFLFREENWPVWEGGLNYVHYWNCAYVQSLLLILPQCVVRTRENLSTHLYMFTVLSQFALIKI